MPSQVFFNVRPFQTRTAYVRDGLLRDIFYQRESRPSLAGAVYKGRVSRLSKGLNFAFVDIGLTKAGFLYGKDVGDGKKPLSQALRAGEDVIVQVKSDPNREKGARLSMNISLPGKYLVYMPRQKKKAAVSRRISDEKERERLLNLLRRLQTGAGTGAGTSESSTEQSASRRRKAPAAANEGGAFLVRTLGAGKQEEDFQKDLKALKQQWEELKKLFQKKAGTGELQKAPSLHLSYLRDFAGELDEILVDDKAAFQEMKAALKTVRPEQAPLLKLHSEKTPLFEAYSLQPQIDDLFARKVRLKSGGFLIIEELEAFTVIDVNSGRFMGKAADKPHRGGAPRNGPHRGGPNLGGPHRGGRGRGAAARNSGRAGGGTSASSSIADLNSGRAGGGTSASSSIADLNREAAAVIARQVRLRHIAGIILIDFVDMEDPKDGEQLVALLQEEFADDKSRPKVFPMGELGMVQITRKRTLPSLSAFISEKCPHCTGTGRLLSPDSVGVEMLFALEKTARKRGGLFFRKKVSLRVFCHPEIKKWTEAAPQALDFLHKELSVYPELVAKKSFPLHRFEIQKIF